MTLFVFANNASSLLASGITTGATTITVSAGQGALFPAIPAGYVAAITVEDVSGDIEVMYATARTGDTMTVERAQEGTTALAFASGSRVEQRVTEGVLANLLQKTGGDNLSGTTTVSGVINLGSGGSIQNGEIAGTAVRSGPGVTSNQILVPSGGGPATVGGSPILTAANVSAELPSGTALIQSGMVVGWTGSTGDIPSGWVLCNGSNGTPDLRDQFIVGGGGALPSSGTYSATTNAASAGTPVVNAVTLAATNIPSHTHGIDFFAGSTGFVLGAPGISPGSVYFFGGSGAGTRISTATGPNTGTIGQPFTPTCAAMGTHSHTLSSPPYVGLLMIMKS